MNRKMRRATSPSRKSRSASRSADFDPIFFNNFLNHGWQLLTEGRDQEALEIAARAIRLQETDESKAFFVQCAKRWSYFPGAEELRDVLVRALREPWAKANDLIGTIRGLLDHDPVIGPAIRRASDAWPRRLPLPDLLDKHKISTISGDPLVLALLESSKFFGMELERLFTSIRAGLLSMAMHDDDQADKTAVRLSCAIAQQCFINEYVFDLTEIELDRVYHLCNKISDAIATKAKVSPLVLAIVAAYQSLDSLPGNEFLLKQSWPRSLEDLLNQQIRERAAERRHRDSITRITSINNVTSVRVQEQYEDNPYPRWFNLPAPTPAMPVDDVMQRDYPFSNYRKNGKTTGFDVLIAGCGTGYHSILFAQSLPGAKLLAIDLSLSSLRYAKQKTHAMGLNNIEYAQGDILELGSLARTFDVISSSGVLHHLADPEQGWRTLLPLLRPDGCMHIGLYSESAHRHLIAAKTWLRTRGYNSSREDIRRARQDLSAAAAHEAAFSDILKYPDFYTMSECRDLLFHSQEQSFTIPRIQAFLDKNKMQFLGFQVDVDVRDQFAKRFSLQREADLSLWHQFETENPDTFKGMYQFVVQKSLTS